MNRRKDLLLRLKKLLLQGIEMFQGNNMPVYSGYATLFIVTAVFPFIMLIISIVNLLPGYSANDVANILFQILPDLGPIKELIISMMADLKDQSGGLLASAAAVTTLWSASKGVAAIQKGLNQLDLKKEKRETKNGDKSRIKEKGEGALKSILRRLLYTMTLVILVPALLVFEMLGGSIADFITAALEKLQPEGLNAALTNINYFFYISSIVVMLFALLVILQIYAVLPDTRRTLKSQLPGALLSVVCWFVFTKLFSFFIPRFYKASSLYGSLASLFLLLLWLRFVVMILFAGAVLNRILEEEQQEDKDRS